MLKFFISSEMFICYIHFYCPCLNDKTVNVSVGDIIAAKRGTWSRFRQDSTRESTLWSTTFEFEGVLVRSFFFSSRKSFFILPESTRWRGGFKQPSTCAHFYIPVYTTYASFGPSRQFIQLERQSLSSWALN